MKCPACGFESADDAAWCDFCKEPFRKAGRPPSPEAPLGPPPPPAPAQASRNGKPLADIDLKGLDSGERIPAVPPWARLAAWAFLAAWLICGMMLLGTYAAKERSDVQSIPLPDPASP